MRGEGIVRTGDMSTFPASHPHSGPVYCAKVKFLVYTCHTYEIVYVFACSIKRHSVVDLCMYYNVLCMDYNTLTKLILNYVSWTMCT